MTGIALDTTNAPLRPVQRQERSEIDQTKKRVIMCAPPEFVGPYRRVFRHYGFSMSRFRTDKPFNAGSFEDAIRHANACCIMIGRYPESETAMYMTLAANRKFELKEVLICLESSHNVLPIHELFERLLPFVTVPSMAIRLPQLHRVIRVMQADPGNAPYIVRQLLGVE